MTKQTIGLYSDSWVLTTMQCHPAPEMTEAWEMAWHQRDGPRPGRWRRPETAEGWKTTEAWETSCLSRLGRLWSRVAIEPFIRQPGIEVPDCEPAGEQQAISQTSFSCLSGLGHLSGQIVKRKLWGQIFTLLVLISSANDYILFKFHEFFRIWYGFVWKTVLLFHICSKSYFHISS